MISAECYRGPTPNTIRSSSTAEQLSRAEREKALPQYKYPVRTFGGAGDLPGVAFFGLTVGGLTVGDLAAEGSLMARART